MTTESETKIQKRILDFFRLSPAVDWCERMNSGQRGRTRNNVVQLAKKGTADIVGTLKTGRSFFFEVKRPGNVPTEAQEAFLRARAKKAKAGWGCSVEDARRFLESYHIPNVWTPDTEGSGTDAQARDL